MADPTPIVFNPRYDDCEPGGRLHASGYVRAMLQTAIDAGTAKDLTALKEPGAAEVDAAGWLERVGDLGVRINQPVMFGDTVEVETRPVRPEAGTWRREFVFKRAGVTLAAGFVDCFDEAEPAAEEAGQRADDEHLAWDGPAPEPPEPPRRAFRAVWRAAWEHLDISGQVDPAALTQMLGDMESRASEALGWSPTRDYENGLVWQVSEHRLELFDAIRDGDELRIVSYIGAVGDDQMVRHSSIQRSEGGRQDEVAHARTRWACADPETGERRAIPDDWLQDLADQMADL
jgi:acyl-CoA thioesterase FadM